eukprot:CAMPEP_0119405604 /NCGR_PEP_ID=MMETSP1335-20130426/197_1 /TAXON_ID=259385 /ORGANISM="Chrysoculter rhomboideus, Strain RCC1486" /LENGTH=31 /DNA_ID= /DNA_START= /DNA_END= /DNA_ORIENTATION=
MAGGAGSREICSSGSEMLICSGGTIAVSGTD